MSHTVKTATGRVLVLVVLVGVSIVTLRGYEPGSERALHLDDAAVLGVLVAMLGVVSVTVVTIAVATRVRNRRVGSAPTAGREDWSRGGVERPGWRRLSIVLGLIAAGIVVALTLAVLLEQLIGPPDLDQFSPTPGTAAPPPPGGGTAPPEDAQPAQFSDELLGYLYATAVLFGLVLAAGTLTVSRRQRHRAEPARVSDEDHQSPSPGPEPASLALAAQRGLAEVADPSRGPREAIIACYVAMERELTTVPAAAPQDFDTASEVLTRAVDHAALRPESAAQLVELFIEARFSVHAMNEGHRDDAVRGLRRVLAELRSSA